MSSAFLPLSMSSAFTVYTTDLRAVASSKVILTYACWKAGSWSFVSSTSTLIEATSATTRPAEAQLWQHSARLRRYSARSSRSRMLEVFSNMCPPLWCAKTWKSSLLSPRSFRCIPDLEHHRCGSMRFTGILSPFTFEPGGEFSNTCPWKKGIRSSVLFPSTKVTQYGNKIVQNMIVSLQQSCFSQATVFMVREYVPRSLDGDPPESEQHNFPSVASRFSNDLLGRALELTEIQRAALLWWTAPRVRGGALDKTWIPLGNSFL